MIEIERLEAVSNRAIALAQGWVPGIWIKDRETERTWGGRTTNTGGLMRE